ncbi:MAG: hypothetical protein ABJE95_33720 [Byssovorax sp.]
MADRDSSAPSKGLREQARSLLVQVSSSASRFDPPTPAALAAEARASAARAARFEPPPLGARLQRFGYGLALPFALARATLRDPRARRRYLRVVGVQLGITVGLGVLLTLLSSEAAHAFHPEDHPNVHIKIAAAAGLGSVLYATISGVEWAVIALSRDYHAAVARDAAMLTGLAPEDDEREPRVRVDFRWLRKRVRDRIRGAFVFASLLPFLGMVSWIPVIGPYLSGLLLTLWGVYWSGVFAAAKTSHGWRDEATAPDPVFLRSWDRVTRVLPGAVRWAPHTYGSILRRSTRSLFAPASRLEARPWELSGLSLARTLRHIPGLYLTMRPFFPVAAAHVLVAHDRAALAATRAAEAELAAQARISTIDGDQRGSGAGNTASAGATAAATAGDGELVDDFSVAKSSVKSG